MKPTGFPKHVFSSQGKLIICTEILGAVEPLILDKFFIFLLPLIFSHEVLLILDPALDGVLEVRFSAFVTVWPEGAGADNAANITILRAEKRTSGVSFMVLVLY